MKPAPFDALADDTAFEEFCFDLLQAEGFTDLVWRGPGTDNGRDIEAVWTVRDPAGGTLRTRWYCECKFYSDSVPFDQLEPKLLAAARDNVPFLLVMTSSRIRTSALNDVESWLEKRQRPLEVRYWNGRDLLERSVRHAALYAKHFGGTDAPGWSSASQAARRLQVISAANSLRVGRRIAPSLQWCIGSLKSMAEPAIEVEEELSLATLMVQASALLADPTDDSPACLDVDIGRIAKRVVNDVRRRGHRVSIGDIPSAMGRAPVCCIHIALLELLLNATTYEESAEDTSLSLVAHDHFWELTIKNRSAEKLPSSWPIAEYRGRNAATRNPSALGFGCWVVERMMERVPGGDVTWDTADGVWKVRLRGVMSDA